MFMSQLSQLCSFDPSFLCTRHKYEEEKNLMRRSSVFCRYGGELRFYPY